MDTNKTIIIILVIVIFVMLFRNHVTIIHSKPITPTITPVSVSVVKPIGGCSGTRYGCCPNGVTARVNPLGTNC
jgi:hypothetical protein